MFQLVKAESKPSSRTAVLSPWWVGLYAPLTLRIFFCFIICWKLCSFTAQNYRKDFVKSHRTSSNILD